MSDPQDLSGVWYGRYDAITHAETNHFIARLYDEGGAIRGVITEPDTRGGADIRRAFVSGQREGSALSFVKQYDGAVYAHAVRYAGSVNADATEVNGTWMVLQSHGNFMMTREKFDAEELEELEEAELEVTR